MAFTKINAAGIGTTETVTVDGLTVINDGSFGGNLSVGGTITYEDVTNVDSVGIITARAGVLVGSGITLSKDGDVFATGVTTTGSLVSSGAISGTIGTFTGDTAISGSLQIADTIQHEGDVNTKLRFPAADTITAETGGSERARIDSSGRLLLGTTTEGNAGADDLTVATSGSTGITVRSGTSGNGNLYFSDGTSGDDEYRGSIQYQHANNALIFATNAVERLRITSDGKYQFPGTGGGSGSRGLEIDTESVGAADEGVILNARASGTTGRIKFQTNSATSMTILGAGGNIGVGVDDPVARLQINSTRNAETDRHTAANYHLALRNPADDNGEAIGISFGITSNATKVGAAILHERDGGGSQGSLQFYTSSDGSSLSERLRIDSDGLIITGNSGTKFGNMKIQSFVAHGANASTSAFSAVDTTSVAAGVGGEIAFHGKYNTGAQDWSYFGHIKGIKENATAGNTACALTFHTRPNATAPQERLRIDSSGRLLLGTTTSNAPTGSLHVKNAYIRIQAANQTSSDFSQEVGIEWSQEEGSDVQVGKIVMRRDAWSGAPHNMDFYSRTYGNQVTRNMTIAHDGGIFFQNLLGNASSGSAVKYSNSDDELRYDTSSKLLKTNITELTKYGIDTVKKLKPSTFTPQEYNKDGTITVGDETLIGFIADEMVTEVPEVVQMYPKSTLTKQEEDTEIVPAAISYDKLTVVLTKALQEEIAKREALEARIAALEG